MKESVALGKTPIRLVPLDQLIETLKNLQLGVGPGPEHVVDATFFEQYRKSWPSTPAPTSTPSLPFAALA